MSLALFAREFEDILHFLNYKDPVVVGIIGLHALILTVILLGLTSQPFLVFLFLLLTVAAATSKRLSEMAVSYSARFGSARQFDKNGTLILGLWNIPILLEMTLIVFIVFLQVVLRACNLCYRRSNVKQKVGAVKQRAVKVKST